MAGVNSDKLKLIPNGFVTKEEREFWRSFNRHMPLFFERLPIVAYYCDLQQRILYANDHALDSINVPTAKVIGHTPLNYYPEEIARATTKTAEFVYANHQGFDGYHYVTDFVTGELKTFKATLDPLFNPETGNLMGVLGVSFPVLDQSLDKLNHLDNNKRLAIIHQDMKVHNFIDDIYSMMSKWRIELFNSSLGIPNSVAMYSRRLSLTNDERMILYFLSNHKSIEEMSQLFYLIQRRHVSVMQIEDIVYNHLYQKFAVCSTAQLIERAYLCGEISFFA